MLDVAGRKFILIHNYFQGQEFKIIKINNYFRNRNRLFKRVLQGLSGKTTVCKNHYQNKNLIMWHSFHLNRHFLQKKFNQIQISLMKQ